MGQKELKPNWFEQDVIDYMGGILYSERHSQICK
jgi:hypothetical protein